MSSVGVLRVKEEEGVHVGDDKCLCCARVDQGFQLVSIFHTELPLSRFAKHLWHVSHSFT